MWPPLKSNCWTNFRVCQSKNQSEGPSLPGENQFKWQHPQRVVSLRLFVIPPSTDHSRHPQIPLRNQRKVSGGRGSSACLWVRVPRGITKTLEAAYLLKTGGQERVKKASQPSVFFLLDGLDSLKPQSSTFSPRFHPSPPICLL